MLAEIRSLWDSHGQQCYDTILELMTPLYKFCLIATRETYWKPLRSYFASLKEAVFQLADQLMNRVGKTSTNDYCKWFIQSSMNYINVPDDLMQRVMQMKTKDDFIKDDFLAIMVDIEKILLDPVTHKAGKSIVHDFMSTCFHELIEPCIENLKVTMPQI